MFKKVLIATEVMAATFEMLKCLKPLKKLGAEECLLVQCFDIRDNTAAFTKAVLQGQLDQQKEILTEQGYRVETRVIPGFVNKEINKIAVEEDCSVIVAVASDSSLIGGAVFGGAGNELIHNVKKPLLLLRSPAKPAEVMSFSQECDFTRHILFPTDFSDNAKLAFDYVKRMVEFGVKQVTLVHVQEQAPIDPYPPQLVKEFSIRHRNIMEEMKKELLLAGALDVDIQLLFGSPTSEIIRLIAEKKIPLAVMGSQGLGFIKEIYLGSVSHNIARYSAASVLLIPSARE